MSAPPFDHAEFVRLRERLEAMHKVKKTESGSRSELSLWQEVVYAAK